MLETASGSSQRQLAQVQRGRVDMVLQKAIAAAREGDLQSLRELAETGCLTGTVVDAQGAGLVHHAARCGQLDCLCFLVTEAGLDANTRALNGATPVHDAAATGHTRELKWLVQVARCNVQVSGEVMELWVLTQWCGQGLDQQVLFKWVIYFLSKTIKDDVRKDVHDVPCN